MLSPTAEKELEDAVATCADDEDERIDDSVAAAGALPPATHVESPTAAESVPISLRDLTPPEAGASVSGSDHALSPAAIPVAVAPAATTTLATAAWSAPLDTSAAPANSAAPTTSMPTPSRKRARKHHATSKAQQMAPPRSDQNKIRTFLQSLPEEHFMVWGYAVETERQRRTQLRQKHQNKKVPTDDHVVELVQQANDSTNIASTMSQTPVTAAATVDGTALPSDSSGDPQQAGSIGIDLIKPQTSQQEQKEEKRRIHRHELAWSQRFQELLDYRVQHGHCDVPDEAIPQLSKWVQSQRQHYKRRLRGDKNSMTDDRLNKLKNIGFRFSIKDDFDTRYNQLLEFKAMFGHTRVPQHYMELNKLGTWVKGQRAAYRHLKSGKQIKTSNHCKLDEERISRLDDIGFEWVVKKRVE